MSDELLRWLMAPVLLLAILGFLGMGWLDRRSRRFKVVIDEERKSAGWGNHWAVAPRDDPTKYIYVGGKREAERRCQNLNCGRAELS